MARSLRIEYPDAFYHVMARGNRRERIFHDTEDHLFFLKTLDDACGRTGWRIHAWALMGNHYHLLRETKGSDPRKLALADLLWRRTVVSQEWIARKLAMRSAANVSQQLRKLDGKNLYQRLPTPLAKWLDRLEAEL
ncbi:MAG TPA: transposase [Verrucomicrobiales bacterium]|nr:transposase [Verrucomicrobiales bacterium]